jgi:predicted ATPase
VLCHNLIAEVISMFLRRLRLKNIRSIADLDISFETTKGATRPWTFLLGENGAGKSTVLRTIALVLAGSEALPEILGDHDWWIRQGTNEAMIEIELVTVKNERRTARLQFTRGAGTLRFLTDNQSSLGELDAALGHADRNYFVVGYGVNRRVAGEGKNQLSTSSSMYRTTRSQNVATLFSSSAALVSLEQWAIDLDYRRGEKGLNLVRQALDSLLPDVTFAEVDKENRRLRFNTADGKLPFELLSDGYQAMAAWCGDLLFRITETFKNYESALNARGLLLIDELDLHLHPVWQRQLVTFLKATLPRFQFVTTTHSPLTIHQAGEGELFILRRPAANQASVLERFEGAPNQFMLHQLIQSPIFGMETLDSPQVAQVRREIRTLKGLPTGDRRPSRAVDIKLASTAAGRAQQVRSREAQLSNVADWSNVPDYLQPTNRLLERIAGKLDTRNGNNTSGPETLKRVVRNGAKSSINQKRSPKK